MKMFAYVRYKRIADVRTIGCVCFLFVSTQRFFLVFRQRGVLKPLLVSKGRKKIVKKSKWIESIESLDNWFDWCPGNVSVREIVLNLLYI